jgi:hypothetical protein
MGSGIRRVQQDAGSPRTQMHIWLTPIDCQWLRDRAEADGETVSSVIRTLVRAARRASSARARSVDTQDRRLMDT